MRSTQPTVFLVWDFGSEALQIPKEANPYLRAVDTDRATAQKHRAFLVKKGIDAKIESCSANHLFGLARLGTLERINRRKPLGSQALPDYESNLRRDGCLP